MAEKCKTVKTDESTWWKSRIFRDGTSAPASFNDGKIGIYKKTTSTDLTGRHKNSAQDLEDVKCTGSSPERVSFCRTTTGGIYLYCYSGEVIIDPQDPNKHMIRNGRYQKFLVSALKREEPRKRGAKPRPAEEEGTWEGQKPIT